MAREVDVVIIGAGISGLTSAYNILKKDSSLRLLVLEAKDRVGGRTLTVPLKTEDGTDTWDLGGQWVGRCQPHITQLLEELGLETHPQYIDGTKFLQLPGDAVTTYISDIPSLSGFALLDLQYFIHKVERMARTIDTRDPYKCRNAKEWDSMTLQSFINATMWTQGAQDCVMACNGTMFGAESSQMSFLYYLTYIASAGGSLKYLIEATEHTAQETTIKGGSQQISKTLMKRIGEDSVLLKCPVHAISQNGGYVQVVCGNGVMIKAKRAIMATPPSETHKILFDPVLPSDKQEIMKRMPVGDLIKIIITYKQSFWRAAGQSGEVVTNGGPTKVKGCDRGPICVVFDDTTASGSPALLAFIGGTSAVQWRKQEYGERQSAVLLSLSSFFGQEAWSFVDYREQDWGQEPYTEGAPVCSVAPGAMSSYASGLRHPFMRIHFAGTESATQWCGFMSGAVQAGARTANEVLYHLRPQSLTAEDLKDTVYGQPTTPPFPIKEGTSGRSVIRLAGGFGAVVLVAVFLKKITSAFASHP